MTMLVKFDHYWFLAGATDSPEWQGYFGIKCGRRMDHPDQFGWKSVNNYLSASLPNRERVFFRFYPEIRWKGRRVHVWNGWDPNSSEPMLQCVLDLGELGASSASDAEVKVQELIEEGWSWNWREGGLKFIHVNDLEKIEGPPPEGPF